MLILPCLGGGKKGGGEHRGRGGVGGWRRVEQELGSCVHVQQVGITETDLESKTTTSVLHDGSDNDWNPELEPQHAQSCQP